VVGCRGKWRSAQLPVGNPLPHPAWLRCLGTRVRRGDRCRCARRTSTIHGRRSLLGDAVACQGARSFRRVPTFLSSLEMLAGSFDAVVALYAFGHVPGGEHVTTFARIFRWLRPGGVFCSSFPWVRMAMRSRRIGSECRCSSVESDAKPPRPLCGRLATSSNSPRHKEELRKTERQSLSSG
jgi:hypothetical protein